MRLLSRLAARGSIPGGRRRPSFPLSHDGASQEGETSVGIEGQGTRLTTSATQRPLSPHLQVWRWHLTMLTSILHRASGLALYGGALVLAGWVVALAGGPEMFAAYRGLLGSPPGKGALFAVTLAIFYHLANGIRHLVWDSGHGFDVKAANATALAVIVFAVAASVAVWVFAAVAGTL